MKMTRLNQVQAEGFYEVHKARPFYQSLVTFMTEGPVVVLVLEREGAIAKWRELMGATNPANAAEGTIRKQFAESIERNAVHGSDAPETASVEIPFFFTTSELL
jgi:nucleoside-diphosphate kinase